MTASLLLLVCIGALGLGLYVCSPSLPALLAVPATFLVLRLGGAGGGNNLSIADFMLFVASISALPLVPWRKARGLKQLFVLVLIYQATTLLSVVDHPNRYDTVEWIHQLFLVGGSAIVGYVLVERGRAKQALGLFLGIAAIMSLWTGLEFAGHGFHAVASLPGGLQKNLLGDLFAAAVLIGQFKPDWSGLSGRWVQWAKYACILGVIASQSRQAMVALIASIGVVYLRNRGLGKRPKILIASLIPVGLVAYVTINGQLNSGSHINSLSTRTLWYHESLTLWKAYPLFGVGERFWYTGLYGVGIQPPNAEISMLATGGIVGLAGFLVLIFGGLLIMWRLPPQAGTLAFAVLLAHVIEGQFDIFWVSASGSLPWIIVGMALAASVQELHDESGMYTESSTDRRHSARRTLDTDS